MLYEHVYVQFLFFKYTFFSIHQLYVLGYKNLILHATDYQYTNVQYSPSVKQSAALL